MLRTRVIPILLLKNAGLVKTIKFQKPKYVGDPINAVRIFNDKEVDELVFLDISATPAKREPNYDLLVDIASEAFMPFGYGGGITRLDQIEKLFKIGVEKVVLNSVINENPGLISEAGKLFGSQSIVASVDVKKSFFGGQKVYDKCGTRKLGVKLQEYCQQLEEMGAGEIVLNSIDHDGTMAGYDYELIKLASNSVDIPVVACGGAGNLSHFKEAINQGGASAVAAGSMFVFNGPHRAVLISYPEYNKLTELFESN